MNPLFQYIIVKSVRKQYSKVSNKSILQYDKEVSDKYVSLKNIINNWIFILLGVFSAGFGLKGFLIPNSFIDGGVTGISLILNDITGFQVAFLVVLINIPFLILGYFNISKSLAYRSIAAILLLAFVIYFVPYPIVTKDSLLIATFGGFFLGLGIGLCIRGGAVIDGTEVFAIYINSKSSLTVGNVILIFNIFIFSAGAYFLSIEIALYAILTYIVASKTVDFVIDGIEENIGVTIISEKSEEIRLAIIRVMRRGCTIYSGKNGYAAKGQILKDIDIVFTVITRIELSKLKTVIEKIDPEAFIIMNSIKDTKGGMLKKKPLTALKAKQ